MNILLAADGSPYTRRAARYLAQHLRDYARPPKIHVLHVHPALPLGRAASFVGRAAIDRYLAETSGKALAVACKELPVDKIKVTTAWVVGDVAEEIKGYVKRHDIDMVVMGSHGRGAFAGIALGSTATKVVAVIKVPVLLVP